MNWILGATIAVVQVAALAWAGLLVRPAPYPALGADASGGPVPTTPLPEGLPAPVERFYRTLYGEELPVYDTVVLRGRATLHIAGIPLPARWRFTHDVGNAYRHEITTTWFGLPLLRVDERFVDGVGRMRLPFGTEEGPMIDQGANLALWAEALWFPAALATEPRVDWAPVDDATALLGVPFGRDGTETFVVRFEPETGRIALLEAMRYKGASAAGKTLWLNHAGAWGVVDGHPTATEASVSWLDDGRPWATFTVESIVANGEVEERLRDPQTH